MDQPQAQASLPSPPSSPTKSPLSKNSAISAAREVYKTKLTKTVAFVMPRLQTLIEEAIETHAANGQLRVDLNVKDEFELGPSLPEKLDVLVRVYVCDLLKNAQCGFSPVDIRVHKFRVGGIDGDTWAIRVEGHFELCNPTLFTASDLLEDVKELVASNTKREREELNDELTGAESPAKRARTEEQESPKKS